MKAVIATVGLLILVVLLWIGSEMHYRNCVAAAQASTPAPKSEPDPFGVADTSRERAVARCSRLPF